MFGCLILFEHELSDQSDPYRMDIRVKIYQIHL